MPRLLNITPIISRHETQPSCFVARHFVQSADVLLVPFTALSACTHPEADCQPHLLKSICVQRQVAEQGAVRARIRQRMVDLLGDDGVLAVPSAASVALPKVGSCNTQVS